MPWILYLISLGAGGLNAFQSGTNSAMKKGLNAPIWSLVFVSAVTFFASLLVVLVRGERLPGKAQLEAVPLWAWTGGLCGLIYVITTIYIPERIGAAVFMGLTVTGAVILSVALDHFGWAGFEEHKANFGRLAGAALMVAGITLIARN